jgi:hypothetical protein
VATAESIKAITISNGEPFIATGTIAARFTGWDSRLVVQTAGVYRADFGEDGASTVREIEIEPSFHLPELSMHIGETITVKGKLRLNSSSPYYWNGVMLMPTSATLADGRVLLPVPEQQGEPIPRKIQSYLYIMTMIPRAFDRTIQVIDLASHQNLPKEQAGGCGVSGGGQGGVMNCGCADGFIATKGGVAAHQLPISELKPFVDAPQLQVPEAATHPLTVELICMRKKTGEK